jgi:hypothetical protein
MSSATITYGSDFLNIRISTKTPEALHYLFMKGLIVSLKNPLHMGHANSDEIDGILTLADVLGNIIPDENRLSKAYDQNGNC